MNAHGAVASLAALLWPGILLADDTCQLATAARPEQKRCSEAYKKNRTNPSGSESGVVAPQFVATASQDDKKMSARVGYDFHNAIFDLQVTTPLQEGADTVEPVNLDGLSKDTTADLGFGWIQWGFHPDSDKIKKLCQAVKGSDYCDDTDFTDDRQRAEFKNAFHYSKTLAILGARIKTGRNEFKWIDPTDATQHSAQHNDWSASATAGFYNPTLGFLAARYEYQGTYKGADSTTVCIPLGTAGASQCFDDRALEGPTKSNKSIARLQWRHFFKDNAAFDLVLSRDFRGKVSSIEVPVYFLQDPKNKGLVGGLTLGWRSDKKALTFNAFAGGALGVIANERLP